MKALDIAKYAALAALGFAAVRIVQKTRDAMNAGAEAGKAVLNAVGEVVATDLNPASDRNLAYRGVNHVGAQVTNDPNFNMGNRLFEWLNADKVAKEKALLKGSGLASDPADVQRQVVAQENFRRSEIMATNDAARAAEVAEQQEMKKKSDFRVYEIVAQEKGGQSATSFDKFLNSIAGVWK